MVIKKIVSIVAVFVVAISLSFAQVRPGGKISFSSGYASLEENKFWYSSAETLAKLDANVSSSVKAYLESTCSILSVPETDYTTAGFAGTVTLSKAYVKARLPWFNGFSARMNAGKQPVSWGYGLFYNAGDLIFGSDPVNQKQRADTSFSYTSVKIKSDLSDEIKKSLLENSNSSLNFSNQNMSSFSFSSSSLSDLRIASDWAFCFAAPISKIITIEAIVLPPIDSALNGSFGRFGSRAQFKIDSVVIENMEGGFISSDKMNTNELYLALDGTIFFDYNICSSVKFEDEFVKDEWQISTSLCKNFTIRGDTQEQTLMIRAESLIKPLENDFGIFGFLSYSPTETTSFAFSYINSKTSEDERVHYLGISSEWKMNTNFSFNFQGMANLVNPQKATLITAGVACKF